MIILMTTSRRCPYQRPIRTVEPPMVLFEGRQHATPEQGSVTKFLHLTRSISCGSPGTSLTSGNISRVRGRSGRISARHRPALPGDDAGAGGGAPGGAGEGRDRINRLRLTLALLRSSGFTLTHERLPDGRAKIRILRAVDRVVRLCPCGPSCGSCDCPRVAFTPGDDSSTRVRLTISHPARTRRPVD